MVDTPIVDPRLVLNWTPSSTTCSTFHWLPQSATQLPLVAFETLCWKGKHVPSNLGTLTSIYSCFYRCPKKVTVTFGCGYLTGTPKQTLYDQLLNPKHQTYDYGIRLFIDIPFCHLIFRWKSKFMFLVDERMYLL